MEIIEKLSSHYVHTIVLVQLLAIYPKSWFEVRLLINKYTATHFLLFDGKKLFDEGIDGEVCELDLHNFLIHYHASKWKIDQIVT